jgi:hypothetical protein
MTSAQIDEPPSAAKTALIARVMAASGIQARVDGGSFLERYALGGSPLLTAAGASISETLDALRLAYEPHRLTWQAEYESHINREFTEPELAQIVSFLESPSGQHFLEARWRMDAYIGSNTEHLVEQIISAAAAALTK